INAFVARKETKRHGMGRFIEGLAKTEGVEVVIIDDVCTKGGSTAQAIEKALEAGMKVMGAICLVDRQQGGGEMLKERFGLELQRIFTLAELIAYKEQAEAATR